MLTPHITNSHTLASTVRMSIKKNFNSERNLNGWLGANRLNGYYNAREFSVPLCLYIVRIWYANSKKNGKNNKKKKWKK